MTTTIPNEPSDQLNLILTDDTLIIDNSRLECFTTCPRLAQYRVLRKRTISRGRSALEFGKALHTALELRYTLPDINQFSDDLLQSQIASLQKSFSTIVLEPEDFRTLDRAIDIIQGYNLYYAREPFSIVQVEGKPFVERSFAIPLGIVGGYKVIWTGRIDLLVQDDRGIFVMDHKTTSMLGATYFADFVLSQQMLGYVWATRALTGLKVAGVIVNALVSRRPSKTGTPVEFSREKIYYPEEHLDEWRTDILHIASDFIHNAKRNYFPKHTKWCIGKYGKCEFHEVCTLPPAQRELLLTSDLYADDNWSPLT